MNLFIWEHYRFVKKALCPHKVLGFGYQVWRRFQVSGVRCQNGHEVIMNIITNDFFCKAMKHREPGHWNLKPETNRLWIVINKSVILPNTLQRYFIRAFVFSWQFKNLWQKKYWQKLKFKCTFILTAEVRSLLVRLPDFKSGVGR